MPNIVTIIVNYGTADLVVDCLRSLAPELPGPVIVIENASADNSLCHLQEAVQKNNWSWAHIVALEQNAGYAAGNNAGLDYAAEQSLDAEYYLLLNPDTVVRLGAVKRLAEFLTSHPRVGIVGSRLEDPDGTPQRSAFRFPSVLGELEGGLRLGMVTRLLQRNVTAPPARDVAHRTDWVAGASMMVRREVIDQVGPMDENYFLYFEEVDYCRRARAAGWECWYEPASRVVHLVGQSTGVTAAKVTPQRVPSYWFDARKRYFRIHHGRTYAALADIAWASGFALWRMRRKLQSKPDTDPPGLLVDFVRHSLHKAVA